jgi:hypothetical protein
MLPREAARVLECSEETVKNRIRSGRLEGRHFTNDRGENRYYAVSEAVHEAAKERRELARVGNVAEEGEVVRENSRDLAGLIMEAVRGNRETVGGEVARHRVEVLEKLEAMRSERQGQYEEIIGMVRNRAFAKARLRTMPMISSYCPWRSERIASSFSRTSTLWRETSPPTVSLLPLTASMISPARSREFSRTTSPSSATFPTRASSRRSLAASRTASDSA